MQTGQNSIAPENSLPQLGQVRWASVLIFLTALQPQPQQTATPRSAERRETNQNSAWHTVVPWQNYGVLGNTSALNRVSEHIPPARGLRLSKAGHGQLLTFKRLYSSESCY